MTRMIRLALVGLLLACGQAAAHRGHDLLSVVEIDAAAGTVTVTHRMAAHDIEPMLRKLAPDASPSLDDPVALLALTAYVGHAFGIASPRDDVPLTLEESRLAGDDVRLIYRGAASALAQLQVRSTLFVGLGLDSPHQVNVRRQGVTRSLYFDQASAPSQSVSFER